MTRAKVDLPQGEIMKKCLTCTHCYINWGSSSYEEEDGSGLAGEWECLKNHWHLGGYDGADDVLAALENGESCQDWKSDAY